MPSIISNQHLKSSNLKECSQNLLDKSKIYFDRAFKHLRGTTLCNDLQFPSKLCIDDMDLEQIFEQINLACKRQIITDPLPLKLSSQFLNYSNEPDTYDSSTEQDINDNAENKPKKSVTWQDEDPNLLVEEKSDTKDKLKQMEDQMLKLATEKPWHMLGEAESRERPDNSLLEPNLSVDFDRKARYPPPVTIEFTNIIEDMVKQRIKDRAFDDVERKRMLYSDQGNRSELINDPLSYRKSEKGLGDQYELNFAMANGEVVDSKLKTEIIDEFNKLIGKLNALSHNSFVPKLSQATEVVNRKLKSVRIEGIINAEDSVLTLPHKLHNTPQELKGLDEFTETDKKRLKRVKVKRGKAEKAKRKKLEDLKPKSLKKIKSMEERETIKKVEKLICNTPHMSIAKRADKKPKITKKY